MSTKIIPRTLTLPEQAHSKTLLDGVAKKILLKKLSGLKKGQITLRDSTAGKAESWTFGRAILPTDPVAEVDVRRSQF